MSAMTKWTCPACTRTTRSVSRPWCNCNAEAPYRMEAASVNAITAHMPRPSAKVATTPKHPSDCGGCGACDNWTREDQARADGLVDDSAAAQAGE